MMENINGQESNPSAQKMGHRRKGSDPLLSTVRGKLQSRRSKVNDQIDRELRMRDGAENLYKATGNKRLKELVTVELSFFNSNIQLLKEELSVMNSTVDLYQCEDRNLSCTPVIPVGLKETSDTDMTLPLKDFILEHYSEDGSDYDMELCELRDIRQAIRTPLRNEAGISLLMEYFNHLHFVEKRFFPPDRKIVVHFHWFDSLTGVPTTQKSIGFEKGSILFNISSLYTQMACKQNRSKQEGIRLAILNFQKAAGALRYLLDHFSHAPSKDMQPETLTMMIQLMLSQAQECLYELKVFGGLEGGVFNHVRAAQEAVAVSQVYDETQNLMSTPMVKEYIPSSWMFMSKVKCHYYMGLAHYYVAIAAMDQGSVDPEKLKLLFDILESPDDRRHSLPQNLDDRKQIGKAHLRESLICHEEALRLHDFSKQLRKIDSFIVILKSAHERSLAMFSSLEEEDDFADIFTAPQIRGATELQVAPVSPEFSKYKVTDIFHKLGPVLIFNAKNDWTVPRKVILDKNSDQGFGFSVRGDSSVIIADIEANSVAEESSMEIGDLVAAIGDKDTKWAKHDTVVNFVRQSGNHLELRLITLLSSNLLEVDQSTSASSSPSTPLRMQSPTGSDSNLNMKNTKSRFSAPWIFTKKGSKESKEKSEKTQDFENSDLHF